MTAKTYCCAALAALLLAGRVVAATPAEPAGEDPSKFFLFHAAGVSIAQARADLSYCIDQAAPVLSMRDRMGSSGGLLGALINARMGSIDRFRMRNAVMRKCMGMLGYDRYQVPQAEWDVIVDKGDIVFDNKDQVNSSTTRRLAEFAAGPVPAGEKLPR